MTSKSIYIWRYIKEASREEVFKTQVPNKFHIYRFSP